MRSSPIDPRRMAFSAALCRGLIEASGTMAVPNLRSTVFRGFMPRPH